METNNEVQPLTFDLSEFLNTATSLSESPEVKETVSSLIDRACDAINGIHS